MLVALLGEQRKRYDGVEKRDAGGWIGVWTLKILKSIC